MNRHINSQTINVPLSRTYDQGKFGRMFPWLPPCLEDNRENEQRLIRIAKKMYEGGDQNEFWPAGYTYLGQFIAHDMTFDPSSIHERQVDMEFLSNFRTPALDLDSIYGSGPFVTSYLYDPSKGTGNTHFLIGEKLQINPGEPWFFDAPRIVSPTKKFDQEDSGNTSDPIKARAVIADPRNDENLVISQLHVAFLLFHNKIAGRLQSKFQGYELFRETQRLVRWHYQWIILYDYLPRVIDLSSKRNLEPILSLGEDVKLVKKARKQIKNLLHHPEQRTFYRWRNEPFVPVEFSAAAFRFGHSQVLNSYLFNEGRLDSRSGAGIFDAKLPDGLPQIRLDWKMFFGETPVLGAQIDTSLANVLGDLPPSAVMEDHHASQLPSSIPRQDLAARNLVRSLKLRLPSGQRVAKVMGLPTLPKKHLTIVPRDLRGNTPLWLYILQEAKQAHHGKRLGPVGSRIIAEVIIGLIQGDKTSFISQQPNWKPSLPTKNGTTQVSNMKELLEYAGVYCPNKDE